MLTLGELRPIQYEDRVNPDEHRQRREGGLDDEARQDGQPARPSRRPDRQSFDGLRAELRAADERARKEERGGRSGGSRQLMSSSSVGDHQ
jgi:hypothetical protein